MTSDKEDQKAIEICYDIIINVVQLDTNIINDNEYFLVWISTRFTKKGCI